MVRDQFWLDVVRKANSNLGTSAFADLEELINSGSLSVSELRGLSGALRSISQAAWDVAATKEAKAKRPWEFE